jgi:hypothetical protein
VGGTTEPAQSSSKAIESESSISDAGDQALRCAWLRVHADLVRSVDPSGQLSAQLLDFADLLEVAEARGWFE